MGVEGGGQGNQEPGNPEAPAPARSDLTPGEKRGCRARQQECVGPRLGGEGEGWGQQQQRDHHEGEERPRQRKHEAVQDDQGDEEGEQRRQPGCELAGAEERVRAAHQKVVERRARIHRAQRRDERTDVGTRGDLPGEDLVEPEGPARGDDHGAAPWRRERRPRKHVGAWREGVRRAAQSTTRTRAGPLRHWPPHDRPRPLRR